MGSVERRDSWQVDLREVSALCLRETAAGSQLLAVGDDSWSIAPMVLDVQGATAGVTVDIAAAVVAGGLRTDAGSEFEGVASDGVGHVLVLQEGPSRVLVLDAALGVLLHTIALHVAPDHPVLGASWVQRRNARGEGLLLLRDGHVLVAKQRDPICLIEFGPAGDAALGYAPGRALAKGDAFIRGGGGASVLEVLATWSLEAAADVDSINDLAVDADGRLHLVSSLSRCIGRLDGDLKPDVREVAASIVALPAELFGDMEDRAEGLAFSDDLGWLVALDLRRDAPNLHALTVTFD